jgi:hypothetical protein
MVTMTDAFCTRNEKTVSKLFNTDDMYGQALHRWYVIAPNSSKISIAPVGSPMVSSNIAHAGGAWGRARGQTAHWELGQLGDTALIFVRIQPPVGHSFAF